MVIEQENIHNGVGHDVRASVACDAPGCRESFYIPSVGANTAAPLASRLGWVIDGHPFAPHTVLCPEHAGGVA